MSKAGFWRWIALISLTGYGFNPLYCDYGPVEEARERLRALDGEGAEELLAREDIDAPEIHLSRALAHYQQSELSEMERALDGATPSIALLKEKLPLGADEVVHELRLKITEGAKETGSDARQ